MGPIRADFSGCEAPPRSGDATANVFPRQLQVFVPFAQKNARLGRGANQGAIAVKIREMKA
jgi:hypothetical protein